MNPETDLQADQDEKKAWKLSVRKLQTDDSRTLSPQPAEVARAG